MEYPQLREVGAKPRITLWETKTDRTKIYLTAGHTPIRDYYNYDEPIYRFHDCTLNFITRGYRVDIASERAEDRKRIRRNIRCNSD